VERGNIISTAKYDMLKETWIYQEIIQQVQAEMQQQRLAELRSLIIEITRLRFPRCEAQVKHVAERVNESVRLHELTVKLSTMQTEKVVRQYVQILKIPDADVMY